MVVTHFHVVSDLTLSLKESPVFYFGNLNGKEKTLEYLKCIVFFLPNLALCQSETCCYFSRWLFSFHFLEFKQKSVVVPLFFTNLFYLDFKIFYMSAELETLIFSPLGRILKYQFIYSISVIIFSLSCACFVLIRLNQA